MNLGVYVQDQWTLKRVTLNLGLRYDYFNAYVPAQNLSAGPFVPARNYDKVECVPCWKDISPRVAVAYDLFGNGKTAIKVNLGRFVQADIYTMARANNPVTRAVLNATRTWTDSNGNFTPDCDLPNPGAQNLSASGGDICGALNNVNFGRNNPNATIYDAGRADRLRRPVAQLADARSRVDQQLRHNVSLGVGYFRTVWGGFNATQNVALGGRHRRLQSVLRHRAGRHAACRMAAATRSAASTTSCRTSSASRAPSSRRAPTEERQRERDLQRLRRGAQRPPAAPHQHQRRRQHRPDGDRQLRPHRRQPAVRAAERARTPRNTATSCRPGRRRPR